MSIFEKMGLVEKVETETEKPEEEKETNIFVAEEVERLTQLVNEMKGKNQHQDKPLEGSVNDSPFGRLMTITEIYQRYNLKTDAWNTIYIVEQFLKALPLYLPDEVKRQSIIEIINSSGMQLDKLITDGNERINQLKNHFEQFTNNNNEVIKGYVTDIERLIDQINQLKKAISDVQKLKEEQKETIDKEIERITNIIDFMKATK
jgi:DNA repair exonuclease SbcCD ATPase subunit